MNILISSTDGKADYYRARERTDGERKMAKISELSGISETIVTERSKHSAFSLRDHLTQHSAFSLRDHLL